MDYGFVVDQKPVPQLSTSAQARITSCKLARVRKLGSPAASSPTNGLCQQSDCASEATCSLQANVQRTDLKMNHPQKLVRAFERSRAVGKGPCAQTASSAHSSCVQRQAEELVVLGGTYTAARRNVYTSRGGNSTWHAITTEAHTLLCNTLVFIQ